MSQYSGYGRPGPQPVMPQHPIDLGELMGSALRVYKERIGGFVLITLLPSLAALVIFAVAVGLTVLTFAGTVGSDLFRGDFAPEDVISTVLISALILLVAGVATGFFTLKSEGMKSQLAALVVDRSDRGGQDEKPTFSDAWQRSSGFVLRILPAYLLLLATTIVVLGIFGVVIGLMIASIVSSGMQSSDTMVGAMSGIIGVTLLFEAIYIALYIIIGTRLYPLIPVIVTERIGGLAAIKRSWQLTKGYGLRTFGYSFVASLIPSVIMTSAGYLGGFIGYFPLYGTISSAGQDPSSINPLAIIGSVALIYLPVMIVAIIVSPFLGIFQTVYTIDLQRRERLGLRPGQRIAPNGYPQQPQQYPGQPQQYPGQPQQYPGQPQQPGPSQPYPGPPQHYPGPPQQPGPGQQPGSGQQYPGPQQQPPGPQQQQYPGRPDDWAPPPGSVS